MDGECLNSVLESGKRGDEYYREMNRWVLTPAKDKLRDDCLKLALIYKDSLDKLLVCLRSRKPSSRVKSRIDAAVEFQSLVTKDIKILTSH